MGASLGVVRGLQARDRLARIAALFSFVTHLVHPRAEAALLRDAVDMLVRLAGHQGAASMLLAALLKAAGERAQIDYARGLVFVRVEIAPADAARLPPHAALIVSARRGRCYLPLWVWEARGAMGFLPLPARAGLARRRALV